MDSTVSKGNLIVVSILAVIGHLFLIALLLLQLFLIYISILSVLLIDNVLHQVLVSTITVFLTIGALYLLKAIFINLRFEENGEKLSTDAPLWQETLNLCEKIDCPIPQNIYVVEDFNAYAGVERGLLPWSHKPYISIGIPLAATLTPSELKSVLAHELGHHSKKHSNISSWIYRVRMSWYDTEYALTKMPDFVGKIASYFYGWFIPLFQIKSFAISRNCEYEADEVAAKAVGGRHLISALCRMEIAYEKIYGTFWPKVKRLTISNEKPPKNIYFHLIKAIKQISKDEYAHNFKAIDIEKTKEDDTHPCIKDRAKFLKQRIDCPLPVKQSSLKLLGPQLKDICQKLSENWSIENEHFWFQQHQEEQDFSKEIKQMSDGFQQGKLSPAEIRNLAMMYSHRGLFKKAYRLIVALYQKTQTSLDKIIAAYHLGHIAGYEDKAKSIAHSFLGQNPVLDEIALTILIETESEPAEKLKLQERKDYVEQCLDEMTQYNDYFLGIIEKPRKMYPAKIGENDKNNLIKLFKSIPDIKNVSLVEFERHPEYPDCPNYLLMFKNSAKSDTQLIEDTLHENIWLSRGIYSLVPFDDYVTLYLYSKKVKGSVIYKK